MSWSAIDRVLTLLVAAEADPTGTVTTGWPTPEERQAARELGVLVVIEGPTTARWYLPAAERALEEITQ